MSVSTDLQAMIWRRLVADPTLAALIGGRVLDRAPAGTVFPYVGFGPSYGTVEDAECIRGQTVTQQINVWSQAQDGQREAKEIADAVRDALHGWRGDETVAMGPMLVSVPRIAADPDGVTTHGIILADAPIEY